jgi:hypothetical protein
MGKSPMWVFSEMLRRNAHVPAVAAGGPRRGLVMSDWERVLTYVVGAVEDQRQAEEFAARAHAGRVMAKKIIDMKLGRATGTREGGAHPVARICRRLEGGGDAGNGAKG